MADTPFSPSSGLVELGDYDIICGSRGGRGGDYNKHLGTKRFTTICAAYHDRYVTESKKINKKMIQEQIYHEITVENGMRFLEQSDEDSKWYPSIGIKDRQTKAQGPRFAVLVDIIYDNLNNEALS